MEDYLIEDHLRTAMRHIELAKNYLTAIDGLHPDSVYNIDRAVAWLYDAYGWLRRA